MKRIGIVALLFVVVLAIGGSGASSASAAPTCAFWFGKGAFKDSRCKEAQVNGNWIKVVLGEKQVGGFYCSEVTEGTGIYNDSKCTEVGGKKKFIKTRLRWIINGTPLAAGATAALANTAAVDTSTVLNAPSLGIRITCNGSVLEGKNAFIQGETYGGAESLTFTGCSEIAPNTCTIESPIATNAVAASLEGGEAPLDRIRFSPKTGKTFATLVFKGSCAESGEQPVNGQLVADAQTGAEQSVLQPLEGLGTTENNSLELAKGKAYLEGGKALLKLVSGLPWSFSLAQAES